MLSDSKLLKKSNYYFSRFLQELSYVTKTSIGRPTLPILIVTHRCNAKCKHCYLWKSAQVDKELSTSDWLRILKELRDWIGPAEISITGGETLLKKDIIQLVEYAAQVGLTTELLSNGLLLNEKISARLINSGVHKVKMSLDGSVADIHDFIRGKPGFFDKVTSAFRSLVELNKRYNKHVMIVAKTAIMRYNIEDVPNIARWARNNDISGVEYQAIEQPYYTGKRDLYWYKESDLWVDDEKKVNSIMNELIMLKHAGYPIINTVENLNLIKNYFLDAEEHAQKIQSHSYKKKKNQCKTWTSGLEIRPNGDLRMCYPMKPFGNAKDGSLKALWKKRIRCWKNPCDYQE